MFCVYCHKRAIYQFKNGKWCCAKSPNSCPSMKRKNSFSQIGRKRNWNTGGEFKKGNIPWNAGTAKPKPLKKQHGGYRIGSGRGKKGWYKGFFCDSSWELAYVIYCLDNKIDIKRNNKKRQYQWNGVIKNYIPDFIVNGKLVEIKGYKTKEWYAKLKDNSDIIVLYEQDLADVFAYVIKKYGSNYIELYE